jgi:hypothetical protein
VNVAEKLDPEEVVHIEDLAISNMWEIAAIYARKSTAESGVNEIGG